MVFWCVDLVHLFLPLVSIATFWCVVYAQSDTDGPCNTCPTECIGRQGVRYWWTSMWGFIVTLFAVTMDAWGVAKVLNESTIIHVAYTFLGSALNPLVMLWGMLRYALRGMAMLANLREALEGDVIAPLYPWSKSHIKIIMGCNVIVNLSLDVHKEVHNLNAFRDEKMVEELSEALVIGMKVPDSKQFNVELTPLGDLALLRSNVLVPYDELKILRGNSTLGMAIASAQAVGYIYGIVVRCVQGLQVSPIEAIACILNIIILLKGFLHNFASLGHRPLLLYLLPQEEATFIDECKKIRYFTVDIERRLKLVVSIASGVLLSMGVYFIVNFLQSLNRACVVPIILFEVSLLLGAIHGFIIDCNPNEIWIGCLGFTIMMLNLVGYVWALIVSFKYWKREEFDVRSSNYLSQVLPYIG